MRAKLHTLSNAARTRVLRIDAFDDSAAALLRAGGFDAVELASDLPDFEALVPHADAVRWLWASAPASTRGLERLQQLERITYTGSQAGPKFDFRQLPRLKTLECDAADAMSAKFLNHPALERLDLNGAAVPDFTVLDRAESLRAVRLSRSKTRSLRGIGKMPQLRELRLLGARTLTDISALESAPQLEALEIMDAVKLADVSALRTLHRLRWLFIEARTAVQPDIGWLAEAPALECAGLWVATQRVDWPVVAAHPRLYDLSLHGSPTAAFADSDETLPGQLTACGRQVRRITRYPRSPVPAIRVEMVPPPDIADAKPFTSLQGRLSM